MARPQSALTKPSAGRKVPPAGEGPHVERAAQADRGQEGAAVLSQRPAQVDRAVAVAGLLVLQPQPRLDQLAAAGAIAIPAALAVAADGTVDQAREARLQA